MIGMLSWLTHSGPSKMGPEAHFLAAKTFHGINEHATTNRNNPLADPIDD
jgi:hypothetical protein